MTTTLKGRGAGYRAANHIYRNCTGPITRTDLHAAVSFGAKQSSRGEAMRLAIHSGWLIEVGCDAVDISPAARAHFGPVEQAAPKYVGQVAAQREPLTPLHLRPALKYKTDSSGSNVRDIDARFQRPEGHHFFTVSSGVV